MQNEQDNQLYMMLGEIKAMLTGLVASQDTLKSDHKELEKLMTDRMNAHSERIGKLEKFQWKQAGVLGVMAVVIPMGLTIVGMILS